MPLVAPEDAEHAASGVRKFEIRKMPKMASEGSEYAVRGFGDSENAENGVGENFYLPNCRPLAAKSVGHPLSINEKRTIYSLV